jgi:DNA-binding GntR family transcriptional regulator
MMKLLQGAPLRRTVLKDRVAELIRDAILAGQLEPGERIVELKLASRLGVGTTAVREALLELESQGFVSRVTNKGTFVTELSSEDVEQILRIRRELEGLAVELLERRVTDADLAILEESLAEMRSAALGADLQAFYRCDLAFHRHIWNLSGNRHLAKCLDTLVVSLFAFFIMKNTAGSAADLLASVDYHAEVLRALGNRRDARKSMDAAIEFFAWQENRMLFGQDSGPSQAGEVGSETEGNRGEGDRSHPGNDRL